ncbi:MAG: glutamine amidotransferase, partial [Pirellulales bacterium]|nr:glutamine amidotransferase [Pirellulales bacterium]
TRTISRIRQTFGLSGLQGQLPPVKQALSEDEDIECVVLSPDGSGALTAASSTGSQTTRFPQTRSTLFAFDCVILSNLSPDTLTDVQSQQLLDWISRRGGGLIVVGPESLDPNAWSHNRLAEALPVTFPNRLDRLIDERLTLTDPHHSIWNLTRSESTNQQILSQLPEMREIATGLKTKPLAQTLGTAGGDSSPVVVASRYGRGRVVVSSAALAGADASRLFDAWGDSPGQAANKLWRNLVYWVTEASSVGRRRLIATADRRFYRPGDAIKLSGLAYDESARSTKEYRVWCLLDPLDTNDMSIYSPVLWPDGQVRTSGETGPRMAWGEDFVLKRSPDTNEYLLPLILSENDSGTDGGFRVELTAYEGEEPEGGFGHGTQVDSTSLEIRVLNDPFESRNPLPNHDLLRRVASVSGGTVLEDPGQLAQLLRARQITRESATESRQPIWDQWWLLGALIGLFSVDWVWRRLLGMA